MNQKTKQLVGVGIFTAIVVVLQLLGGAIRFGTFSISLVLVPIVVGAAVYGWISGAWLGFVFGVTVLLTGDAALFLAVSPLGTVLTVLLKGTLCGLAAGLVYHALSAKNRWVAIILSALICPVVNTGVFLLGCLVFFMDTINGWAAAAGFENAGAFMIIGLVGINFLLEVAVNTVLAPVISRLIRYGSKK